MTIERDACGIGFVADAAGRSSREVVDLALAGLRSVRHRGAIDADAKTGDGAGLLLPIPHGSLLPAAGIHGIAAGHVGVAMLFAGERERPESVFRLLEGVARVEGLEVIGCREVPTEPDALGDRARRTMPRVLQGFLACDPDGPDDRRARAAHRTRRRLEEAARAGGTELYVVSLGFRCVTYKALVAADQLAAFYPDLLDPRAEAHFAVFHQRYSTNTAPSWERAQPFRVLCHNGEINTITGNVRRMQAREGRLGLDDVDDEDLFRPAVDENGSDSAILDEVADLLMREGGRDARHAMAMLVPAAWEGIPDLDPAVRGFYRWHASVMEPWDGPAALIFTDGVGVGAALDRNGLRPLRYAVCGDGLVVCASEAGAVDVRGHGPVRRGKVGPGEMIFVDPRDGGFQTDPIERVARRHPYGQWAAVHRIVAASDPPAVPVPDDLVRRQVAHGYTREDVSLIVKPAASAGLEPTFSMGDDAPIAPFSEHDRSFFNHFKQRFAQVTNPAIDHVRERFVTSTTTLLGRRDPLLWVRPEAAAQLEYDSFLLFATPDGTILDATWPVVAGADGLRGALAQLAARAVEAVAHGAQIVIVSDDAVSAQRAPVPSLMAVGAVHAALVQAGLRTRGSVVVHSDDARSSHDVACLIGFGAEAVYPRLALATVASLAADRRGRDLGTVEQVMARYREAIEGGVLKVLSKLGISCLDPYRGAQAFDILGLAADVVDRCFPGAVSPIGGLGLGHVAAGVLARHARAYAADEVKLANPGYVKFHHGGEYHATNPTVVRRLHRSVDPELERLRSTAAADDDDDLRRAAHVLHRAVRDPSSRGLYERFAELVDGRPPAAPRDLLALVARDPPVPLAAVEPASSILRRFSSGAVSHGAISREAHETLAQGLNMVGSRSNTGEGGEDPSRYRTEKNSRIKQVASARFGVTPEYCAYADELQIKIAQGSKPGEGGQLPGHKVTEEIARLRHTQPGVALISPAPHHDIYSIEDLAQLVFDLRQVNPEADVSVKLVAETGVGTIAAGVVKAMADVVHIAGADGGTGASPVSSIKNAGLPWEIGLAETQRALCESGLRSRVRVRVDGGLKTGRDVLVAALLGADEFSFGTAVLLAEGCIMVRTCHLDTCPVGIATQRPDLRAKFAGTPDMVAAYLTAVAEDVRGLLAGLGLRSLDAAIGRVELLEQRPVGGHADLVDLSSLLRPAETPRRFHAPDALRLQRSALGDRLYDEAWPAVRDGEPAIFASDISTEDRAVGARLGGAIGRAFGEGRPPGSARATFNGSAGQSFGAFLADGVELHLIGEANDYLGKGMGGGRIAIVPPDDDAGEPFLAGNTVLYGATGGELFVAGRAGERFAVRNSGTVAVIEGIGEHGCEYMTGGTVLVLGPVGMNLGAGMTGGVVYVHDPEGLLPRRVNPDLVQIRRPTGAQLGEVHSLLSRHVAITRSVKGGRVLASWPHERRAVWRVAPKENVGAITRRHEGTPARAAPVVVDAAPA